MTDNWVDRHLRTEELYQKITSIIDPAYLDKHGETPVRAVLDAILSQGKIEGRRTALDEVPPRPVTGQTWQNRAHDDDVAVIREVSTAGTVRYARTACPCRHVWHEATDHEASLTVHRFMERYEPVERHDPMTEGWQRIVDSV